MLVLFSAVIIGRVEVGRNFQAVGECMDKYRVSGNRIIR